MADNATARHRHRLALGVCLLLALVGWAAVGPTGLSRALVVAVWLCCVLLCFAWGAVLTLGSRWTGDPRCAWLATAAIVGGFAAVTVGAPGLLMRPGHGSLSADLVGLVLVAVMVVLLRHAVGLFVLLPDRMLPVLPGARTRGPTAGAGSLDSAARGADDQLHEVRASLAGLSSALHLLTDQDRLTGADRAHLSGMLGSEIERLQRLLDCPGSQPAQPVALHAVPAPMIATRRAAGQDVRLGEMHCACCRDGCCPACTLACPDAVEEIINILLVNAATHAPGATVVVSGSARDGRVQLRVSDDGPGVPGHLRADLFTRGVRREGSPGHGIGLELARRLARSQHGDLWLEDAPVGASFVLEVPAIVGEACA